MEVDFPLGSLFLRDYRLGATLCLSINPKAAPVSGPRSELDSKGKTRSSQGRSSSAAAMLLRSWVFISVSHSLLGSCLRQRRVNH